MTKQAQNTNEVSLVEGKRIDDEHELIIIWREHYEDLYTPKHYPDFDKNFKKHFEESLHNIEEESYGLTLTIFSLPIRNQNLCIIQFLSTRDH
jgi:hypothetical protein